MSTIKLYCTCGKLATRQSRAYGFVCCDKCWHKNILQDIEVLSYNSRPPPGMNSEQVIKFCDKRRSLMWEDFKNGMSRQDIATKWELSLSAINVNINKQKRKLKIPVRQRGPR